MPEAASILARLADALRGEHVQDPETCRTAAAALDRYLAGSAPSLDAAFGLDRSPGQRDERTLAAIARRDAIV